MLDLVQLLQVPHIDNNLRFDLSPNGQSAVFSWNKSGNWEIYQLNLDDLNSAHLLTHDEGAKFAPKFSPGGNKIIYALDLDGSESYHIVLHDLESNISTDLTPDIGYAHQPYTAWSPDGNQLAVLSDVIGHFALYLLTIATGETKLLFDIHRPCWDVRWSPNGKWLAVEVEAKASDRAIYIVNSDDGTWHEIKNNDKALNAEHPAWSPDSQYLAFSGESGEWHDIGLYEVKTSKVSWLSGSAGDDSFPCWPRDERLVGWIHAEGAATRLEVQERGGAAKRIQVGAGLHSFPQFTSDGRSLIFVYESPSQPPDLWELNLDDDSFVQLTFSMPLDELHDAEFIQPEEVWYAGKDGVQVPAMLYHAKNAATNSPAIVNIHGGPNWHLSFLWYPIMSYMASRGWTVLAPNYRGSTGYGKKWQNASRFDMGGVDTDDCAAGVKYLIENNLADKNKIAVTGRSHGGYLTMTCMTMYPELWAIGSAVVPFLNWIKSHYESREDLQHWNIENMGDPEKNRQLWTERSPYFYLDKINAPVQMICGANDPRCPASESMDAHDKLVELEKKVELLLYEGEGHSFLDLENVIDSELKRMEFLENILE
ncbi:MAG: S9 family peptidase [Anaerolineales bacterium]|nr:S9 family peptidase [Anaerolineales bacterium]